MTDIFELLAACRREFPDELQDVEAQEKRVRELLELKEYADDPTTKKLVEMCRQQIVTARVKLATVRVMDDDVRTGLWIMIAGREWVISMLARDFDAEIEQIGMELERELGR